MRMEKLIYTAIILKETLKKHNLAFSLLERKGRGKKEKIGGKNKSADVSAKKVTNFLWNEH